MTTVDLLIPMSRIKRLVTWEVKRKPRFRRKYRLWCEDYIGEYGRAWRIVMVPNDQEPPSYYLRCPRAIAILFKLEFL